MMKSESDLMKGIDDKFQKLLSQFQMNMNILGMKSKRQQEIVQPSNVGSGDGAPSLPSEGSEYDSGQTQFDVRDVASPKNDSPRELVSEDKQIASLTDLESDDVEVCTDEETKKDNTGSKDIPSYKTELEGNDYNSFKDDDVVETVYKYITQCNEMKNKKNKNKKNKNIMFAGPALNKGREYDERSNTTYTGNNSKKRKSKKASEKDNHRATDNNRSGKFKSDKNSQSLSRKGSKTATNFSKKPKKKHSKNTVTNKDWITYNRNNAFKVQKTAKSNTMLNQKKEIKIVKKSVPKVTEKEATQITVTEEENIDSKIQHFDTVENKLIQDFIQNELRQESLSKIKVKDETVPNTKVNTNQNKTKKNRLEPISFRQKLPLKVYNMDSKMYDTPHDKISPPKKCLNDDRKNNCELKTSEINRIETKPMTKRGSDSKMVSNKENDRRAIKASTAEGRVFFNSDIAMSEKFKIERPEDVFKAKSEMKLSTCHPDGLDKENKVDLEEVKIELDEFFREIPFVVGRSISRTFNLGLSFQHAVSMLKRTGIKKEVKDALILGRPQSEPHYSESLHCQGNCEALFSGEWTREDEEAWEINPWDPELNKKRPRCTCLPNNCTTLKNVLKQLTIKTPGFNIKSLPAPSNSTISTVKLEVESGGGVSRAKSQTRTELLRNIRNIQLQLTSST